jgi:hypothetical protein
MKNEEQPISLPAQISFGISGFFLIDTAMGAVPGWGNLLHLGIPLWLGITISTIAVSISVYLFCPKYPIPSIFGGAFGALGAFLAIILLLDMTVAVYEIMLVCAGAFGAIPGYLLFLFLKNQLHTPQEREAARADLENEVLSKLGIEHATDDHFPPRAH